jgi:FAD/FMN-containing dehydrogenase
MLKTDRPPGWDKPKMTDYLEALWANTIATFAVKPECTRLFRIDDVMMEVATNWTGGSPTAQTIVPLMLYFRSHSAFRAAAALGLGGAHVEGYATLRQCLEFAGYAALVHGDPSLAEIWWGRDQGEESEKRVRRAFTHGAVRAAIEKSDARLSGIYEALYDRVIQWGAHPNEKSVTGNLKLDLQNDETRLLQVYLHGDSKQLDHWLRTANQVGICALKVFRVVHAARFEALGVVPGYEALSNGL